MSELNVIRKDFKKIELKIALCYPNLYQAGIASYAIQLLYSLFNSFENVQCERFYYAPKTLPKSIETDQPLKNFDIICFTLQYELDYINLLEILSYAGIPLNSENRPSPLILAGGPCALENPLPLSDFIDIFVFGDLEPILDQLVTYLTDFKKGKITLEEFKNIPGLFIPQLHDGARITKLVAPDLDDCYHPTAQLISESSPFGKSLLVEVVRGCPRGCRFCLIGYQALPMRYRSLSTLKSIILKGVEASKVDKISLIGPSISDSPHLEDLCAFLIDKGIFFSLPSLRVDTLSEPLLELLKGSGLKTLSIAPESGSSRLRTIIGKPISDDLLLDKITQCFNANIENLKMYFLMHLPTETSADAFEINRLLQTIIQKSYKPTHLHLSINPFIPKPHTPFQWEPPLNMPYLQKTIKIMQKSIKALKIYNFEFLDPRWARLQGMLSRGSRILGRILKQVLTLGKSLGAWRAAMKSFNYSIEETQNFRPVIDEPLPWDFIDIKLEKKKLLNLYHKAHS